MPTARGFFAAGAVNGVLYALGVLAPNGPAAGAPPWPRCRHTPPRATAGRPGRRCPRAADSFDGHRHDQGRARRGRGTERLGCRDQDPVSPKMPCNYTWRLQGADPGRRCLRGERCRQRAALRLRRGTLRQRAARCSSAITRRPTAGRHARCWRRPRPPLRPPCRRQALPGRGSRQWGGPVRHTRSVRPGDERLGDTGCDAHPP